MRVNLNSKRHTLACKGEKMRKYTGIFALFLMFIFCSDCVGQNKTAPPTDTIKSESKGVITSYGPTTSVRTIKQDRVGNIWVASNEGIIRYDGKSFTKWQHVYYDGKTFTVLRDNEGNALTDVWSIIEDKKGNKGIFVFSRYDEESLSDRKPTVTEIAQSLNLFGILEANDGGI
jgi:hypothetical protein